MEDKEKLLKTPLYEHHIRAGGQMIEFAGYSLPARYSGVNNEHNAVRENAGIFDVSHMGEIVVSGPDAIKATDSLISNNFATIENGRACYTGLLSEKGTFIDDVICYRVSDERVFFCVNAVNRSKAYAHIAKNVSGNAQVTDESDSFAQIAVQGPKAVEIVNKLAPETELDSLKRFRFINADIAGVNTITARTGYTGENGFEIYCSPENAGIIWDALLESGLTPCGLGARDTLRLEAGLALYGNDIDEEHTPFEAGMGWTVKIDKGDFIGREALINQKNEGIKIKLTGFELIGRGIPRTGMQVSDESGNNAGHVTSGTMSPTLKKAIGMAYLPLSITEPGNRIFVDIRGKQVEAVTVSLPFYKRS